MARGIIATMARFVLTKLEFSGFLTGLVCPARTAMQAILYIEQKEPRVSLLRLLEGLRAG